MTTFPINDGARPSRLELDRRAAGELPGPVPATHSAELDGFRAQAPPLDLAILRARAHRITTDHDAAAPKPKPKPVAAAWWRWLLPVVPVLAALLVVVLLPRDGNRTRGSESYLETFVLQDGVGQPWEPGVRLREGDRVQFAYNAQDQGDTLVLLSVDGEGTLSVFWPAEGDAAEPISPLGTHLLDDSIELDGATGPEVFVAFFGEPSVGAAVEAARAAHASAGTEGLRALHAHPDITVVVIEKE